MRSKASFRSHPIHPALIPFPFAFLFGAFAFDLFGWLSGNSAPSRTAAHLLIAGLIAGVIAAIPGLVDYLYTVPPHSSGKHRAKRHALANGAALLLFAAAWVTRGSSAPAAVETVTIEFLATAILSYAGWQGGVLVSRNLISVDHRYAQAGKWREIAVDETSGPIVVAKKSELKEGQMKLVRIGERRIVLARTDSGYVAFDDRCTHRGGSLAGGVLVGDVVHCLWHGSQFDCANGKPVCGPAKQAIGTYPTSDEAGGVAITLKKER